MRYNKITLENLFSDYVKQFDIDTERFKSYLSQHSLKCYHKTNKKGNTIYRYTLAYGAFNETKQHTLKSMINAINQAIKTNKPLLKIGV